MLRREKMFHSEKIIEIPRISESSPALSLARSFRMRYARQTIHFLSSLHDIAVDILVIGGYTIFYVRRRKKFLRQQETA